MTNFANLVHVERNKSLKTAQKWMWFVGILTLGFQLFLFFRAPDELAAVYRAEFAKQGTVTLEMLEALPAESRAEFDAARAQDLARLRLVYGAGIGLGLTFIGCAFMMLRKPMVCSVTALTLYIASIGAMAALDPMTLIQGILMKILIIAALISALKAAMAAAREAKEAREAAPVTEEPASA